MSPSDPLRRPKWLTSQDSCIRLAGSRRLGFAEFGRPDGEPVIICHGLPSTRIAASGLHQAALQSGVRLIAPDRPGFGLSDPSPGRQILDWAGDVAALADSLQLQRFSLMAISSGMPYALACAIVLPERLRAVAILGGLGRLDVPGVTDGMQVERQVIYALATRSPRVGSLWMRLIGRAATRAPERVVRQQMRYLASVDQDVLRRNGGIALRAADLKEAFRQGAAAAAAEAALHVSDWGFGLRDVGLEVYLWNGALDWSHPVAMVEHHVRELPKVRSVVVPDVGALGYMERMPAILADMLDSS